MTSTRFADPADLERLMGITFTEAQVAKAEIKMDLVTSIMQDRLQQDIFAATTTSYETPGVWGELLPLPQWPVTAVSDVAIDGVPLATSAWKIDPSKTGIRRLGFSDASSWPSNIARHGRVSAAARAGRPFWGGPDVTVTIGSIEHGYEEVPPRLRAICLSVCERGFTVEPGVVEEQLEDWGRRFSSLMVMAGQFGFTNEEAKVLERFPKPRF